MTRNINVETKNIVKNYNDTLNKLKIHARL